MTMGISFRNVSKHFGKTQIIKDFSLDVAPGEFIVVVGPSGSGKSTTLRLLAGLEKPSAGSIFHKNLRIDHMLPNQRNVGMVFQNYALYPHMTVRQNLTFGLESQKTAKKEIQARVVEIAEILEITALLKKKPRELSGGQKQRVALGRALIRRPEIFLMDEPLSNLDAQLREKMRAEIRHLHNTMHVTTLYVTHDQTEAMTMADRIVVLRDGKIEQIGSPMDIYQRPETLFVASFFGSPPMNLIPMTVSRNSDRVTLRMTADETVPRLVPSWGLPLQHLPCDRVHFGFRPEIVHLTPVQQSFEIPVTVLSVEHMGPRWHAHVRWGQQKLTVVSDNERHPKPNEALTLYVPLKGIYLFDDETGRILPLENDSPKDSVSAVSR